MVVLLSGAGSTMAAVLAASAGGDYPARIVAVGSDRADAGGLAVAAEAAVPTFVVAPGDYDSRAAWNRALGDAVDAYRPDIVLSAGFMRILDADFVARFSPRLVNSHPALLPSFPGAHAVRDALAYGVAVTGATLHVVDAGVDTGPIIAQTAVPVAPDDDEATLHERIKEAERAMLIEAIARLATSTIEITGRRVVLA